MSLFNTTVITVTPRSTGSRVNGRYVETPDTSYEITGSWQPATPREIQSLPEGRRERSVMKIYTSSELTNFSANQNPDRVTVGGRTYEVFGKERWGNGLIPHFKYLVTEVVV